MGALCFKETQLAVSVRTAQPNDVLQLVALWHELNAFHVKLDPRFALDPNVEVNWRETFSQWLQDDNCRMLIAEESHRIVGYIFGTLHKMSFVAQDEYHGFIADVIVSARYRRQGIGEMLYHAITEWFRERGVVVVELNTATANLMSQNFWHKMGFTDYMTRLRTELT
jgi:ribosomal protein S18 acetylase RimI-like enzyme